MLNCNPKRIKKGLIQAVNLYQTICPNMEQVTRIELASSPWQGGIIAIIRYLLDV